LLGTTITIILLPQPKISAGCSPVSSWWTLSH